MQLDTESTLNRERFKKRKRKLKGKFSTNATTELDEVDQGEGGGGFVRRTVQARPPYRTQPAVGGLYQSQGIEAGIKGRDELETSSYPRGAAKTVDITVSSKQEILVN